MKQTAVEWLLENLISEPHFEKDFNYNLRCWDKAKAMEKEQIIEAYQKGFIRELGNRDEDAEEYYSKNFKSE